MTPTLYILMRTDMASMNAGKAMAQAAHAANAFGRRPSHKDGEVIREAVDDWEQSTLQGFGTTITLGVGSKDAMCDVVDQAQQFTYPADVILDPTYPVKDGEVTHLIPVHTCAYVFVDSRTDHPISRLRDLELHP